MVISRRWVLERRPQGLPAPEDFRLETVEVPEPEDGQMLVRNVWIPVDPGMRNILSSEDPGPAEFKPQALGTTVGYLTVGVVMKSRVAAFAEGDFVTDYLLWQERALSDGRRARKITERRLPPTTAVGVLGVPGLSAYFGLLELGAPKAGETVVVTSAAGAVGSAAGQIARIKGGRPSAPGSPAASGSMRRSTTRPRRTSRMRWRRPARMGSTCCSTTLAGRCWTRCCR